MFYIRSYIHNFKWLRNITTVEYWKTKLSGRLMLSYLSAREVGDLNFQSILLEFSIRHAYLQRYDRWLSVCRDRSHIIIIYITYFFLLLVV